MSTLRMTTEPCPECAGGFVMTNDARAPWLFQASCSTGCGWSA